MATIQIDDTVHQGICPSCGAKGKRVDTATVKCMLSVSLNQVRNTQYFFCREPGCSVVYFSGDGTQFFHVPEVRERVFQKEPLNDSVFVCYCFRYTLGEIQSEAESADDKRIVDAINSGIRAGQCACDWRNPQGDCCLGNVLALKKHFQSERPT